MQVVEGLKTRIFSGFSGITSFFEKNIKIYKKGVDKWGKVWYSNKAVGAVSTAPESGKKKPLDSSHKMW